MSRTTATEKPPAETFFMDPPEAASILRLSTITIARMIRAKELPGVIKLRARYKIRRAELMKWIEQGCPPLTATTAH